MNLNIDGMLGGSINRISHVNRYSSILVHRKENVAEHCWYVAFYAFLIGADLKAAGYNVGMGKLLSRALVHDIDESMTGDFLRTVKYSHPDLKGVLDEVSVAMIDKIAQELGGGTLPEEIGHAWLDAKADDIEGEIIQLVDLAQVVSYVWEEVQSGNEHVRYILGECAAHIRKLDIQDPVAPYVKEVLAWIEARTNESS